MANEIRTGNPHGFNKGCSSMLHVSSQVQQTPEVGQRIYQPKCCRNNNENEDNSPKTLNDKSVCHDMSYLPLEEAVTSLV